MQEDTFRWVVTGAVIISTLCIFLMAAVCLAVYRVIAQVKTKVEGITTRVEPLIDTARMLAQENAPKFTIMATRAKEIANNAKEISDVATDQAHRFAEVGRDVADRAKVQVARIDTVVDQTVMQAKVVSSNVKDAVMRPVREASGVMAGVKAAMGALAAGRRPTVDHTTQDEEMFI